MAKHCLQAGTCKFDRKEGASSMIRCSSWMVWFHNKCMEEPEQLEGFWSCYSCRKISYAKMVQNNASNLEKKDLVVSNSILRSIDCAKLEKTDVRTLNNSTINDAK